MLVTRYLSFRLNLWADAVTRLNLLRILCRVHSFRSAEHDRFKQSISFHLVSAIKNELQAWADTRENTVVGYSRDFCSIKRHVWKRNEIRASSSGETEVRSGLQKNKITSTWSRRYNIEVQGVYTVHQYCREIDRKYRDTSITTEYRPKPMHGKSIQNKGPSKNDVSIRY